MAFYPFPVHQRETGEATILRRLCWPDELDVVVVHFRSQVLLARYESVPLWNGCFIVGGPEGSDPSLLWVGRQARAVAGSEQLRPW